MTPTDTITENLALAWKQQRVNVLPGVTARGMASLIDGYDRGYLRQFALACEGMIELDDTLSVCVPKYLDQVSSQPWDVLIGEEVPEEQREEALRHQEVLKHFYSNLGYEDALDRNFEGDIEMVIRRTVQARFYRYSVSRIIWQPSSEGLTAVARYCNLALFDNTTGKLRWAGVSGTTPGTEITDPENWLIAASDRCLMKALAVCYIFKKLPMQDALNFCQRFGIPAVHGMTDAKFGSTEWDTFVASLRSFANDLTIATSKGSEIKILENTAANGEQVFGWIIESMKRAMVTIALGSDLKTMSRENGTGASLQGDDGDLMTAAGCRFVTANFNRQFDRRIIEDQFGPGTKPLAFFKLLPPQNTDTELEMKVDEHVFKFGVNLTPEDLAERYGRTHDEEALAQEIAEADAQEMESANEIMAANRGAMRAAPARFNPIKPGASRNEPTRVHAGRPARGSAGARAAYKEELHKRDGGGKFTSKGWSEKTTKEISRGRDATKGGMRDATPEERKQHAIPPAFKDVKINHDGKGDVLFTARNEKGKAVTGYKEEYIAEQQRVKYDRVAFFAKNDADGLAQKLNQKIASKAPDYEDAIKLRMFMQSGFRNGGKGGGGKVESFGGSSILTSQVRADGAKVHFNFTGKKGVPQRHTLTDSDLADHVRARQKSGKEKLFEGDDQDTLRYLQSQTRSEYKVHDIRTWYGSSLAHATLGRVVEKSGLPKNDKELKALKKRVGKVVGRALGNDANMALKSYIHPDVFAGL